jgi:hypothetical protein
MKRRNIDKTITYPFVSTEKHIEQTLLPNIQVFHDRFMEEFFEDPQKPKDITNICWCFDFLRNYQIDHIFRSVLAKYFCLLSCKKSRPEDILKCLVNQNQFSNYPAVYLRRPGQSLYSFRALEKWVKKTIIKFFTSTIIISEATEKEEEVVQIIIKMPKLYKIYHCELFTEQYQALRQFMTNKSAWATEEAVVNYGYFLKELISEQAIPCLL